MFKHVIYGAKSEIQQIKYNFANTKNKPTNTCNKAEKVLIRLNHFVSSIAVYVSLLFEGDIQIMSVT